MTVEAVGLISLSTWLAGKIGEKGFEKIYSNILPEDVDSKFYKAVDKTSNILQKEYPDVLGGSIDYFFKKETIFNELLKLLFKDSKVNLSLISANFDTNTLPKDFINLFVKTLRQELFKDKDLNAILTNKEIFVLAQGLDKNIKSISNNSKLALNEIVAIKNILLSRIKSGKDYADIIKLYSKNALNNLSEVNFIGLGVDIAIKRKGKNLEDIFVKPNFKISNKLFLQNQIVDEDPFDDSTDDLIPYKNLFKHSNKIVVLGNPGSGKSVLVKSLICDILKQNTLDQATFPIRVELRKYLSFKKTTGNNLLKYISIILESEYQIYNITTTILEDIFFTQNTYVFFDGLDEIFKIEDKIEIRNDIMNFHNLFPKIKSLTTSRIIGYDEAKFKDDEYCELIILSFNDDQIREYITKWYTKEEENPEVRRREIGGFLSKRHEIDRELISNPLLLSLIIILYRNILKLPESKLEIYQSCTRTLVDKWDASKELEIDLQSEIYKNKEKILADLAYWQYEQLSSDEATVSYEKAKKTVAKSLKEKLNLDVDIDEMDLSESFMSYAQKRSIYFDNNFTHKTFLEYYTAYWIYSNVEKKHKISERDGIISKYIDNSFWHIVLELLLNMIDKDQADCEIMDALIDTQLKNASSLPFLLTTCTSFKNISKPKVVEILESAISTVVSLETNSNMKSHREDVEFQIFDNLKKLYITDLASRKIILDTLKIKEENVKVRLNIYIMYLELEIFTRLTTENLNYDLLNKKLFEKSCRENPYLFILNTYFKSNPRQYFNDLQEFIRYFGIEELYTTHASVYDHFMIGSYLSYYLSRQTQPENIQTIQNNFAKLEKLGLPKKQILDYVKDDKNYFFLRTETVNAILNHIEVEKDMDIKKILMIYIVKGSQHFNPSESKSIKKMMRKNSFFNKIEKMKDKNEKIKYIIGL